MAQLKRLHDMISVNTYNTVNVQGDVTNLKKDVSRLDKRVNKAVAGSAALAALHPLDFDPDANGTLRLAMVITIMAMLLH